jgi:hypothetical protein
MGIEAKPFRFMAGIFTSLFGLATVLMIFGFSTLVDPELQGIGWWLAVSRTMVGPGLFGLTLGFVTHHFQSLFFGRFASRRAVEMWWFRRPLFFLGCGFFGPRFFFGYLASFTR